MNRPSPFDEKLNPHTVAAQSAALARHLHSAGVSFLPSVDSENATALESLFQAPIAAPEPTVADSSSKQRPSKRPSATKSPPQTATAPPPIIADAVQASYEGPAMDAGQRTIQLRVISETVSACTRCEQLASCRTQTVFGEGSVTPRVAFFGEGPNADEDRTGRPLVGKAGELLTKMIEACSFRREDVYIFNTVKCRPPGNRNPDPSELANCREYFQQQLAILRPEYIVCMGAISSQTLLGSKLSVGRLRGKLHRYFDSKVLVTYHPAYLLINPDAKKAAWQDLQLMLRDAGIAP